MIYSIVSLDDIFYSEAVCTSSFRSSNPYDYIADGYYLDNGVVRGGKYVHINSNISGYRTSSNMGPACK